MNNDELCSIQYAVRMTDLFGPEIGGSIKRTTGF
jgi:hypothetical protein